MEMGREVDEGRRDDVHVLTGHGSKGGILTDNSQERWYSDRTWGRRDGLLIGHERARWCTDWTWMQEMVTDCTWTENVVF